jgi:hypothetical protein
MDLTAMMMDSRLSDAARVLGYVVAQGEGEWVELSRDECRRILHGSPGKDRVARALGELQLFGYVERQPGGRSHADRFRFSVRETRTLSDSIPETRTLNVDSVRETRTLKCASPSSITTPPPTTPTAREKTAELKPSETDRKRLGEYLADHARALDMMLGSADHSPTWCAAVWGKYGPSGTQERAYSGIPPDRRPAVLATALMEYATNGKPYDNRHFDGYLRKAVQNEQRGSGTNGAGHGRDRGEAADAPRGKPGIDFDQWGRPRTWGAA